MARHSMAYDVLQQCPTKQGQVLQQKHVTIQVRACLLASERLESPLWTPSASQNYKPCFAPFAERASIQWTAAAIYNCLHTLSQRCTAITTGGGRGCGDVLTAMQVMPQQEVQINAARL